MAKLLEDRSLTELRAMASAVGVTVSFSTSKRDLIKEIRLQVDRKSALPIKLAIGSIPRSEEGASQESIRKALKELIDRGLILTFPTIDSWHLELNRRQDSGSMNMPLQGVVRCAQEFFK